MSLGLDTLSRFQSSQSLLFLLNAVCLDEKQQLPILVFGFTWRGLEPMIYYTWGKHAKYYNIDAVISMCALPAMKGTNQLSR